MRGFWKGFITKLKAWDMREDKLPSLLLANQLPSFLPVNSPVELRCLYLRLPSCVLGKISWARKAERTEKMERTWVLGDLALDTVVPTQL